MKKSIPELVRILNYYTEKYDEGNPQISDKEWDDLYFELVAMENGAGYALPDSPTQKITYSVVNHLNKVTHNHKMLSLDKTKDLNEINSFLGNDQSYLAMLKMDGLTCSLTYKNGKLVSAETRGNGEIGEDVLHNAQVILSIPKHINYKDDLIVDGEIISTYSNFEKFKNIYKNPRNFAAGSIRLLDSRDCAERGLRFIAWDVIKGLDQHISHTNPKSKQRSEAKLYITDKVNLNLFDKLSDLEQLGFLVVPFSRYQGEVQEQYITQLTNIAKEMGYPIDGIVFKFDDINYSKTLGETAHHFKNAMAYKFYDEVYDTILRDIEWSMGRTGVLTPIAIFDVVDCDGAEVSRASLYNINIMYDTLHTPFKGQKIQIYKSNMIIPQVYSAEQPETIDENLILKVPTICPECGGPLKVEENENVKILTCLNEDCPGRALNHLVHFCSKKGLDIKGLSEATLDKLMDWGWVNTPKDLFTLAQHKEDWYKKDGFGVKSVDKILMAIENAKNCSLTQFISSLGIPFIGNTVAKLIVEQFSTWNQFMSAIDEKYDFSTIPTFGEAKSKALLNFNYTEAKEIVKYLTNVNTTYEAVITTPDGKDYPKVKKLNEIIFCITGKLHNYKNRDELKSIIEFKGGRVVDSISSKVNYLINNNLSSTSSKNKKAKELNIPIISEEEFLTKLNNELF